MPLLPPMDLPLVEKPEVVIDGRADESAWAQAAEASDFVVYRPQPGAEPSAKTRVRVMTSEDALYVHFEAKSPKPEDIRSGYGRRDSRRNDDYVGILLDTQGGAEPSSAAFSSSCRIRFRFIASGSRLMWKLLLLLAACPTTRSPYAHLSATPCWRRQRAHSFRSDIKNCVGKASRRASAAEFTQLNCVRLRHSWTIHPQRVSDSVALDLSRPHGQ